MKKISTLCIAAIMVIICSFKTNAAVVVVNVEDNEFSPSDFSINVGDQVMWMWDNSAGQHTTTSTVIPAGAASWDEIISGNAQMFTYTATVPGSYDYICVYHSSMGMVGHFTVTGTTGITDVPVVPTLSLNGTSPVKGELQLIYSLPSGSKLNLRLIDMTGKSVRMFFSSDKGAGVYTETYSVADLRKGVYIIEMETADNRLSRKVLIQ